MALPYLLVLVVCAMASMTGAAPNYYYSYQWKASKIDQIINFCGKLPEKKNTLDIQMPSISKVVKVFHQLTEDGRVVAKTGEKVMKKMTEFMKEKQKKVSHILSKTDMMVSYTMADMQGVMNKAGVAEITREDCSNVRKRYTVDGVEFQSASGRCNNIKHSEWGASNAEFLRFAPVDYGGYGFNEPTTKRFNGELPSPRDVSLQYHVDEPNTDDDHSYFLMQWGQFLDHDITLTPEVEDANCDNEYAVDTNPDCIRIAIRRNDPQFGEKAGKFQRDFMPFTRSAPSYTLHTPGDSQHSGYYFHREQFNELSATIDASNVYGSDAGRMNRLRDKNDPALLSTENDGQGKPFLPFGLDSKELKDPDCMGPVCFCFFAGDVRAAEQPFLSVVHGLWVREHNRIVAVLRKLNPKWGPHRLFFETRNIVKSIHQHIVYDEYLPNLMGSYVFGALIGKYSGYNPDVNPGILNEFAAAVFRLGHSQLRNRLSRVDENYKTRSDISFRQAFFQPHRLLADGGDAIFDNYVRGLLAQQSQQIDRFVSDELVNHLFEEVNREGISVGPGIDLAALNIQRGRDHGLPSYFEVHELAYEALYAAKINVKKPFISSSKQYKLRKIYGGLERIDLWVGGLSETPLENSFPVSKQDGGQLGPTFSVILADQFRRLRDGDRFFWLNKRLDPIGSKPVLTTAQTNAIRNTNLATYICNNANNPTTMKVQPRAFRFPQSYRNRRLPCSQIHTKSGSFCLDLSSWGSEEQCVDLYGSSACKYKKQYGGCNISYIRSGCSKTCQICPSLSKRADGKICFLSDVTV